MPSATGGEAFFWSGTDIVHVPKQCHDVEGHYGFLGVAPDADAESVKRAAKRRLMEAHPDHGGTEEEFMRAYAAYETLVDPAKRAEYDVRPPETAFTVELVRMPSREETGPYAPSHGARTAYYKEPDIIMSEEDEKEVDAWAAFLLEAARVRRRRMAVKVAVRKSVDHIYAYEDGNIFTIQHGTKAKMYMAHVLMTLNGPNENENEETNEQETT